MLLVVFGAGASFDSVRPEDLPPDQLGSGFRPPKANGLFRIDRPYSDIIVRYRDVVPLVYDLRPALAPSLAANLEDLLESWVKRADAGDLLARRQLFALRYYIRDVIKECGNEWLEVSRSVTNYSALIDRIEQWRHPTDHPVALVTFNYDLLLDNALSQVVHKRFSDFNDYVDYGPYALFKLHGSVDWVVDTNLPRIKGKYNNLVESLETLQETTEPHFVSASALSNAFVPAIAIPLRTKPGFVLPAHHLARLRKMLRSVTQVIIIGWRGQEADFLGELNDNLPRDTHPAIVVSSNQSSAASTAETLNARLTLEARATAFEGFSDLCRDRDALLRWLADPQ